MSDLPSADGGTAGRAIARIWERGVHVIGPGGPAGQLPGQGATGPRHLGQRRPAQQSRDQHPGHQHPGHQHPGHQHTRQQPPLDRWFSSESAMGLAASILIGLVTLLSWLTAWADWNSYQALKAYEEGGSRDAGRLDRADLISGSLGILAALALLAAAIVYIVWLWRVRWNAEMFCRGEHRFTRGWVLGGWICPVVNLWYPKWVVDDVVAASDPRTPPQLETLRGIPGTRLVWAWWLTWVVGVVLDNVAQRSVLDGAPELGDLRTNAVLSSISAVSTSAAAVLAVAIIRRVNDLQANRPWTPWWSAGPALPPLTGRPPAGQPLTGQPPTGWPPTGPQQQRHYGEGRF